MNVEKHRSSCRKLFGKMIVDNNLSKIIAALFIVFMFGGVAGAIEAVGVITNSGTITVTSPVSGEFTGIIDNSALLDFDFVSEPEPEPLVKYEELPCSDALYYGRVDESVLPLFRPERLETANNGSRVSPWCIDPVFADIDADGDQDLAIIYSGIAEIPNTYSVSFIAYYRNNNSVFELQTGADNPFYGYESQSFMRVSLRLADLDADGDFDAVVSNNQGSYYFTNYGTAEVANFSFGDPDETLLSEAVIGDDAYVQDLADIDGDGDYDAVVLPLMGNPELYRNIGTVHAPVFSRVANESNPLPTIESSPIPDIPPGIRMVDVDNDGDFDLLYSLSSGAVRYYENQGSAAMAKFVEVAKDHNPFNCFYARSESIHQQTTQFSSGTIISVSLTYKMAIAMADVDGDGVLDLVGGTDGGELVYRQAIESTPGDLDRNGYIDSDDADLALALVVGRIQQKSCYLPVVDVAPIVDGESQPDGKIDIGDATVILHMAADEME